MTVCFELIDRSTGEIVPHVEVDNRMRAALGHESDATNWLANWYNRFGIALACGDTWAEIEEIWVDFPDVVAVAQYLASIYDIRCW